MKLYTSRSPLARSLVVSVALATVAGVALAGTTAPEPWAPSAASYLGDSDGGVVAGAGVQADGTVVLAANIGASSPGGIAGTPVGDATASSGGAIVRLSPDGGTVISVTRVAGLVTDLAVAPDGSILVAAMADGVMKLSADGATLAWARSPENNVHRVDVGASGEVAVLSHDETEWQELSNPGSGRITVYDADGNEIGSRGGHHNTLDIAVESTAGIVVSCGWRQASAFDGSSSKPVQIAHLYGHALDGALTETWKNYDWSTDQAAADFLNKPENNMADTRCYRVTAGQDGKLYAGFEAAGGNHIFRYDPHDVSVKVSDLQPKAGRFHSFSNSKSEHKTVFARYQPGTGDVEAYQEFCGRLTAGKCNTVRVRGGAIAADAEGRVYIGGDSASGLPLDVSGTHVNEGEDTNGWLPPGTGDYQGGAYLLVMDPSFSGREFVTRLTGGATMGIGVRNVNGTRVVAWGGRAKDGDSLWTSNAIQSTSGGGDDGFFAVIGEEPPPCGDAADCDDRNACTEDVCSSEGACTNTLIAGCGSSDGGSGAGGNGSGDSGSGDSGAGDSGSGDSGADGDNGAGASSSDGGDDATGAASSDDGGCSCRAVGSAPRSGTWALLLLAVVPFMRRRRR